MAGRTTAASDDILKMETGQATTVYTTTAAAAVNVGLFVGDPTAGGTEVSGGGYARVNTKGKWGAPTAGTGDAREVATNADVTFADATADWAAGADIDYFAVYIGTTMVRSGLIVDTNGNPAPKPILAGDTARFPAGSFVLTDD